MADDDEVNLSSDEEFEVSAKKKRKPKVTASSQEPATKKKKAAKPKKTARKKAKYYDDSDDDFDEDSMADEESDVDMSDNEMAVDTNQAEVSSDESEDSYDEDLYRDDADRLALAKMTDMERQAILYERGEKRNQIRERNTMKARIRAARGIVAAPKPKGTRSRTKEPVEKLVVPKKTNAKKAALNALKEKRLAAAESGDAATKKMKKSGEDEDEDYRDSEEEGSVPVTTERKVRAKKGESAKPKVFDRHKRGSDDEAEDVLYDATGKRLHLVGDISYEDALKMQVKRDELASWLTAPHWEKSVKGTFVRISLGSTNLGDTIYRLAEVIDFNPNGERSYSVSLPSSSKNGGSSSPVTRTNMMLKLAIAASTKEFPLDIISNKPLTTEEYEDWVLRMRSQNLTLPSKMTALQVSKQLHAARTYVKTEEDVEMEIKKRQAEVRDTEMSAAEKAAREKHSALLLSINKRNRVVNTSVEAAYSPESAEDSALNPFARRPTLTSTTSGLKAKMEARAAGSASLATSSSSDASHSQNGSSTPSTKVSLSLDLDDKPSHSQYGAPAAYRNGPVQKNGPASVQPLAQPAKVISFAQYLGRR